MKPKTKYTLSLVWDILFYLLILGLCAWFLLMLGGCRSLVGGGGDDIVPVNGKLILNKVVYQTNWMVTLLILGIGLGVVAFLNGQKFGIPIIVGCFASLATNLAVIRFGTIISIIGLLASVAVVVYSIFLKDRALKEVVDGVQQTKFILRDKKEHINNVLKDRQSKTTQKLVKKIKKVL